MTTSLGKKLTLPTFQLDALVLLCANEAKLREPQVKSYVEACQRTLLLIAKVGHAHWLSNLQCGSVDVAHVGSTSNLLVHGNPAVGYIVATVANEV